MASVPPQGGRKHPHQEFIQIDTTNILFICGGAFGGIDKLIQNRVGNRTLGFGAEIRGKVDKKIGEVLAQILPEDLLKFGLIPEFVGRVPIIVTLDALDEEALVSILTEPRNALVKQYRKFLDLDGVQLEFQPEALQAIASEALRRNTGARGLRAIIEDMMLDVMYDIPSRQEITKVTITKDTVYKKQPPLSSPVAGKGRAKTQAGGFSLAFPTSGAGDITLVPLFLFAALFSPCFFPTAAKSCHWQMGLNRINHLPSGNTKFGRTIQKRGVGKIAKYRIGWPLGIYPDIFCPGHRPVLLEPFTDPAGKQDGGG